MFAVDNTACSLFMWLLRMHKQIRFLAAAATTRSCLVTAYHTAAEAGVGVVIYM